MSQNPLPSLTAYYQQERAYLRDAGRQFAQRYPKLARRLDWNGDDTQDPHVERLLESFAFLTARIQRQTDDLFPEIARSLIHVLYPALTNPLPPMSVAEFQINVHADSWKDAVHIPIHTSLNAHAQEGQVCAFKTLYPLTMWPLRVDSMDYVSREQYPKLSSRFQTRQLMRIGLTSLGAPLSQCPLSHLQFYLGGTDHEAGMLYQTLFSQKPCIAWHAEGVYVEADTLRPAGFKDHEACLPYPGHAHPGFRLLHEFFYCPQKFLFCDLSTQGMKEFYQHVEILISIPDDVAISSLPQGAHHMRLWCTPIVNLFGRTTDPFRLTHQNNITFLCPDQTREATTEIHSIQEVLRLADQTAEPQRIPPYFSFDEQDRALKPTLFWHGQHTPSQRFEGTDYQLHFVDLELNPHIPYGDVVFAHVLCTNRGLAHHIPVGGILESAVKTPTSRIVTLKRPGATIAPPQDGVMLWTLIRHLAINPVASSEDSALLESTRSLLTLYQRLSGGQGQGLSHAIVHMTTSSIVRPLRHEAWRGFITGQHVQLTLDDRVSPYAFLLGQVLAHFWASQNDLRSFTECSLKRAQSDDAWVSWAPPVVAA